MGERSLILSMGVRLVFHTALLFSLFLLFAGHNSPGGGFSGGLVAGAAFVLRSMSGERGELRRMDRVPPEMLLGIGLLLACITGITAMVAGGDFLESGEIDLHPALLDDVHLNSVLAFDAGVYLVVLGLVMAVLDRVGVGGEDRR